MEDQSIKLKDHLSLTIVLMWIDLKERKYRHHGKREEDLFLLMINDIPRLGTGYLVISRMQQNIIIQININSLNVQTAVHILCRVIV